MVCESCKNFKTCINCENHENCKTLHTWFTCMNCEHKKYGGHRWENMSGRKTCLICGLVSRDKIFVHDDRLVFCANMTKQYVPKPRKPKEPKKPKDT